jgi:hypothetical protein
MTAAKLFSAASLAVAVIGGAYLSAAPGIQETVRVELLPAPPGEYSSQPNLSADRSGNVYLIWTERPPQAPATLRVARFDGRAWSPSRAVTSGRGIVASAADIPAVHALPSGRLVVAWMQVSPTSARSYGVRLSQSIDGGISWSEPVTPHPGHDAGENGFISLYSRASDSVGVMWLDGRRFTPAAGAERNQTMLLDARVSSTGGVTPHVVVDSRACECCHTSFAATPRGGVVVFRDRSSEEIRDIAAARLLDGQWSTPHIVHADGWYTRSCPVNGPAVASFENEVAVAWFSAARDTAKVQLSFSSNMAGSFAPPVRIDAGDPIGRVGLVMADARTAWVSWLERSSQYNSQLHLRKVTSDGRVSPAYTIDAPNLTHATGFPRMVQRGGELIVAWSTAAGAGAPPTVKVARVPVSGR